MTALPEDLTTILALYLTINHEPTELYLNQAQLQLSSQEKEIQAMQKNIKNLEQKLKGMRTASIQKALMANIDRLRRESRNLVQIRETYRSIVSPLRRYPPELIAELLSACFEKEGGTMDQEDRIAFVHLRCVCRSWREVLFTTPSFWRGLSFFLYEESPTGAYPGLPQSIDNIAKWYDRAGATLPLTMIFEGATMERYIVHPLTIPFIDKLITLTSTPNRRWCDIRYMMNLFDEPISTTIYRVLSSPQDRPWEHLRRLSIVARSTDSELGSWEELGRNFSDAVPNLESMWLRIATPSLIPLSHRTLKQLKLELFGTSFESGIHTLSLFPSLEHMKLWARIIEPGNSSSPIEPIELPALKSLELEITNQGIVYGGYLRAPGLETLDLLPGRAPGVTRESREPLSEQELNILVSLIQRSSYLNSLGVAGLTPEDIATLVHSTHHLDINELHVSNWDFLEVFLKNPAYRGSDLPYSIGNLCHPVFQPSHFEILEQFFRRHRHRVLGEPGQETERVGDLEANEGEEDKRLTYIDVVYDLGPDFDTDFQKGQEVFQGLGVGFLTYPWLSTSKRVF